MPVIVIPCSLHNMAVPTHSIERPRYLQPVTVKKIKIINYISVFAGKFRIIIMRFDGKVSKKRMKNCEKCNEDDNFI